MSEINVYVDPDASGGGTGVDWTNAYTSLSAAEAAEQTDLVSDGDTIIFNCRASSSSADTTAVTFDGWNIGLSNDITIEGNQTTGIWNNSAYHLSINHANAITFNEAYCNFLNLQISTNQNYATSSGIGIGLYPPAGAAAIIIDSCIIKEISDYSSKGGIYFLYLSGTNAFTLDITNTVVCGYGVGTGIDHSSAQTDWTTTVTNCTVSDCALGIRDQASMTIKNCAVFNNADDFNGSGTISYCASDDGDGSNAQDLNENASGEWAAAFTDYANDDFSVKDASSLLYNNGTNIGAPDDDIIGTSRPQATTVDIGAFEFIAAAGVTMPIIMNYNQKMRS